MIAAFGATGAHRQKCGAMRAREEGLKVGLVRPITLWPFPDQAVSDACAHAKEVLCVEMIWGR